MSRYDFVTLDVFTTERFGGNPLAVFPDACGLTDAEMQSLSSEMNLSETTFVLPPADPANTARMRIFNRTAEMPFAGHPSVGTGFVLATSGRATGDVLRLEVPAGVVKVSLTRDGTGGVFGARIDAPRALELKGELPREVVASCVGLAADDIDGSAHEPLVASVGVDFVLARLAPGRLARATPRLDAFRAAREMSETDRLSLLVYELDGDVIRARMFAPLAGTWEDPATGSANAALAALLLRLDGDRERSLVSLQGVEMGRPSRLELRAWRAADDHFASVGGGCVPMFAGVWRGA